MTEQHQKTHLVSLKKAAELLGISQATFHLICKCTHGPTTAADSSDYISIFGLEIYKKNAVTDGIFFIPEQPVKQKKFCAEAQRDGLKFEFYDNDAGWIPLENSQFGLPVRYYRIPRQPIPFAWIV
ncbi:hypothetical protein [Candidatus Nitrotoga fabula]|uniref:hypothetical protein n=1 Tax=Candidatus Nitrotoga fabula TaxID=2182327 RepID=UPI001BB485C3|nr:hypothetical protein [Candidatus Nitrotoga fabula]